MPKLLTVVGATGSQGRGVISWFQTHKPDWKIRGLTRNPSSSAAKALSDSGVEVVKADLNDPASLKPAFAGSTYIFAYTDFSTILGGVMERFQKGEVAAPAGKEAARIEVAQGKNIADAAGNVPELERLVWSSLPDVTKISGGKYTQVFHFDSKPKVLEIMRSTKGLEGKVSELIMGAFASNVKVMTELFGFKILEDKTALWKPFFAINAQMPYIDVEKDTGAFVNALIEAPAPTSLLGVSEWMSAIQWLELWSAHTGVKARCEEGLTAEYTGSDPSGVELEFFQTGKFCSEYGYIGPDLALTPEEFEKKGFAPIPRTPIADYIAREDWSSLIG